MRGQGRRRDERSGPRTPGSGIAPRDHPINESADDSRAGHDFKMTADDAIEAKRGRIERNQPEVAGKPDDAATDGVGQGAPDVKSFGDRRNQHCGHQRKARDKDETEAQHDVQRALVHRTGAEIAEFGKQYRANHDHSRRQTGREKCKKDDEQTSDKWHSVKPNRRSLRVAQTTKQSKIAAATLDCFGFARNHEMSETFSHAANPSLPWRARSAARARTSFRFRISTARRRRGYRARAACAPARNSRH